MNDFDLAGGDGHATYGMSLRSRRRAGMMGPFELPKESPAEKAIIEQWSQRTKSAETGSEFVDTIAERDEVIRMLQHDHDFLYEHCQKLEKALADAQQCLLSVNNCVVTDLPDYKSDGNGMTFTVEKYNTLIF